MTASRAWPLLAAAWWIVLASVNALSLADSALKGDAYQAVARLVTLAWIACAVGLGRMNPAADRTPLAVMSGAFAGAAFVMLLTMWFGR